jgi:hypothetical protein
LGIGGFTWCTATGKTIVGGVSAVQLDPNPKGSSENMGTAVVESKATGWSFAHREVPSPMLWQPANRGPEATPTTNSDGCMYVVPEQSFEVKYRFIGKVLAGNHTTVGPGSRRR